MYLALPTDVAYERISSSRLSTPLNNQPPENDKEVEAAVIDYIYKVVKQAGGDVAVLIDACSIRHRIREELKEFLDKTQFPVYSAPMGKTAINEDNPRYGGVRYRFSGHWGRELRSFLFQVYIGSISHPDILEKVEGAKLIISIGSMLSDFNTGNFTYHISKSKTVEVQGQSSDVVTRG